MNTAEFIQTYQNATLSERSVAIQHFLHLCDLLGHPHPVSTDPTGEAFTFEKHVGKMGGGKGFADVWKRRYFAWEYKSKGKDLQAAFFQLQQYRDALENPPLLVVCDIERIVIHTNFTNTPHFVHTIPLEDLDKPEHLTKLRAVFFDPVQLRPGVTRDGITKEAATRLAGIAQSMRERGLEAHAVARFLDRIIFCMFAEDSDLLPNKIFTRLIDRTGSDPARFSERLGELFHAMAHGGDCFLEDIRHFNGNLYTDSPVLQLTAAEIGAVRQAAKLDWGAVDPSIFGTLFERGLDPGKRTQLGAHYTSRADIETLIDPVVLQPLRREWDVIRDGSVRALDTKKPKSVALVDRMLHDFLTRLGSVTVLDPACGSGNFLYVTLQKLKDLEKEVIDFAYAHDFSGYFPEVGPWQLYGIEINPYAADLAQMTVWIGYLQWLHDHGYLVTDSPVLRSTENIQCRDAIIDRSAPGAPGDAQWPSVDFIVGNPPFLGDKLMRRGLGDNYVDELRHHYRDKVPGNADLCCYWFEMARQQIAHGRCKRAGLLATQGIRGGGNREVLRRIKETGDIFFAISNREWILDGANVHISMVGFDAGSETRRNLDNEDVDAINPNLTPATGQRQAITLVENLAIAFIGNCKGGPFDISEAEAITLLHEGGNVNGRPNSDIVRPVLNTDGLVQRSATRWIVDTGELELDDVVLYERPFAIVEERVRPVREENRNKWLRENWWRPQRMRSQMRMRLRELERFLVTPTTSKYRVFTWLQHPILPDHQLVAFARDDDYSLGLLHSRVHEVWALSMGTKLETRPRYTPTSCFETFPFPEPTPEQSAAIAEAARQLDTLRSAWLNPPEWTREEVLTFPGSVEGPWARYVENADAKGIGEVRYPRLTAKDAECAAKLSKRTLTGLYNERPAWLDRAHRRLDEAVAETYGWPADLADEVLLAGLLALNLKRAG